MTFYFKDAQTVSFRGSKSRNKVSVGEPAEGSLFVLLKKIQNYNIYIYIYYTSG